MRQATHTDKTVACLRRQPPQSDAPIDMELLTYLIHHISFQQDEGAILIFLPGWSDISKLYDKSVAWLCYLRSFRTCSVGLKRRASLTAVVS